MLLLNTLFVVNGLNEEATVSIHGISNEEKEEEEEAVTGLMGLLLSGSEKEVDCSLPLETLPIQSSDIEDDAPKTVSEMAASEGEKGIAAGPKTTTK